MELGINMVESSVSPPSCPGYPPEIRLNLLKCQRANIWFTYLKRFLDSTSFIVFPVVYPLRIPLFDKEFRDSGFVFALMSDWGCHSQIRRGLSDRTPGHMPFDHTFCFKDPVPILKLVSETQKQSRAFFGSVLLSKYSPSQSHTLLRGLRECWFICFQEGITDLFGLADKLKIAHNF